ncbi:MAG TPA: RluA family pseudouridine synthase [Vicinamibacterales bacterium]|nr:RluA family pseudouridine synthase [Vicinamibacterales bacterium]
MRLDKRLKAEQQELSWRQIREAIEKGQVTVDGRVQRDPGLDVYANALVDLNRNRPAQSRARASFDILHEDDEIIVLNKPAGLLSIPSSPDAGKSEDTVLRRVREYMEFKLGHKSYVGMLHRLDRDTSGSLAVALSKDAHAAGRELFKEHRFERHYLALVHGIPDPPKGTINARISSGYRDGRRKLVDADRAGLDATTDYRIREQLKNAALLELRLHTGRQHQIRLHLEKIGHPLIGERVYSGEKDPKARTDPGPANRNMLHAWTLAFPHPITGNKISVEAPLPNDFLRMMKRLAVIAVLTLCSLPAFAQTAISSPDGRRQMQAVQTTSPIVVDGALDEDVWKRAAPATDFIQADPLEGQPATEITEVRLAYDADYLYIAALCRDSDPSGIVVNEIRKDFAGRDQDTFEVLLDTFADRRNGFVFATNSQGAKADTQIANEGRDVNTNWDAVWWVQARKTADGWAAEFRIPFKTLRFEAGDGKSWGVNFARRVRRKNELSYWSPVSRAYSIFRASSAGTLAGLPPIRQGRNLRIKPFLAAGAVRGVGESKFDGDATGGVDIKAGITPSLTFDATINPDFAQAEADEQQVNLTQFSLFFPEKREFFLENAGIFYFGDIPRNSRSVARFRPPEEDLLLFFSRRIGLSDAGEQQPLHGGARLTGRAGGFTLGLMTMQSKTEDGRPSTNYTVARVRRDLFRSSDVGAIVLSREPNGGSADFNRVVGVDTNFRFFKSLSVNGFFARSESRGVTTDQDSGKASIGWEDSKKRLQTSIMKIGEGFRDDLGFVRRTGVTRQFYDAAFFPEPEVLRNHGVRRIEPHGRLWIYTDPSGEIVSRSGHVGNQTTWNNGSYMEYAFEPRVEAISRPFNLSPGVSIPAGRYDWYQHLLLFEGDHSRALSGSIRYTTGGFWSGTQHNVQSSVLYRPNFRMVVDLGLQVTKISLDLPKADFTTTLVSLRTGYSFSSNMFLDTLLQYRNDVKQFSANVRFNLIHHPLSDFFIVYNESQFTEISQPAGRGLVVKYTQMFAF